MDYRKLNELTVDDKYSLPNMNDLFTKFRNCRFFSTLDLGSGYHHVRVKPADRHKTAFITPWGLFEWVRMTFGFKNAPAHFQRAMDSIFQDLSFVLVYLDDVFVMSATEAEHVQHLRIVCERFRAYNLKCRLSKCEFLKTELTYLNPRTICFPSCLAGSKMSSTRPHTTWTYLARVARL